MNARSAETEADWESDMTDVVERLRGKDDTESYKLLLSLEASSAASDELYADFDAFLSLLDNERSFVRVRGFRLCCAQAKWDTRGKLQAHLSELLRLLNDEKPTSVRQALAALSNVLLYRPELDEAILSALNGMELLHFKDSMRPLIEKDVAALKRMMD